MRYELIKLDEEKEIKVKDNETNEESEMNEVLIEILKGLERIEKTLK